MKYKFKIGDKVKLIKSGKGYILENVGKIGTIIRLGMYHGKPGYEIEEQYKGCNSNKAGSMYITYDGMISEEVFELCEPEILIPEIFN